MRTAILLAALSLSACADHSAPVPSGQWQVLTPGAWDMDPHIAAVPADLPKIAEDKN